MYKSWASCQREAFLGRTWVIRFPVGFRAGHRCGIVLNDASRGRHAPSQGTDTEALKLFAWAATVVGRSPVEPGSEPTAVARDRVKEFQMTNTEQDLTISEATPTEPKPGIEGYLQSLQRQLQLNREFANAWAAAVTSLSGVIFAQTRTFGQIVAEQAKQAAEQARAMEGIAKSLTDHVGQAENAPESVARVRPQALYRTPVFNGQTNERATGPASPGPSVQEEQIYHDVFDEFIERLVDDDILSAATQ